MTEAMSFYTIADWTRDYTGHVNDILKSRGLDSITDDEGGRFLFVWKTHEEAAAIVQQFGHVPADLFCSFETFTEKKKK